MKLILHPAAWLAALLLAMSGLAAQAGDVGFQTLTIPDGSEKPLTIGIWYPAEISAKLTPLETFTQDVATDAPVMGQGLPLVVISHGSGGTFAGHYDTALALAHAGFVVAAATHNGDAYQDQGQMAQIWRRPAQLRRLIDYMLAEWPQHQTIDPTRIGVFGFSAGGFTALVAVGGTPDLRLLAPHCRHARAFECVAVIDKMTPAELAQFPPPGVVWVHDPRIKAAVIAAPAIGYTFDRAGLKDVRLPIQLWRDEFDHVEPSPDYVETVRDALPTPPEYHVVANADHYDFLAPCSATLTKYAPLICAERPGFDRAAFHATFDAAVVAFFEKTLAAH
jgi:predicted dienelactone hydrolase